MTTPGLSRLENYCRRFETAVGNFGASTVHLKANEKAFHASGRNG